MTKYAFIISTEDGVDQICETRGDANREAKDLRAMGCKVVVTVVPWDKQDAAVDRIESRCRP